jgi:hypothetical protein
VISRFQNGLVVEDHAASDTMELVHQLGLWRTALLALRHRGLMLRSS